MQARRLYQSPGPHGFTNKRHDLPWFKSCLPSNAASHMACVLGCAVFQKEISVTIARFLQPETLKHPDSADKKEDCICQIPSEDARLDGVSEKTCDERRSDSLPE